MMNGIENNLDRKVFYKYLEIRQDIYNNLHEVFLRQHYYTHKHRGNRLTDINVSLNYTPEKEQEIQIFVRYKDKYIKENIIFKSLKNVRSSIKSNVEMYE